MQSEPHALLHGFAGVSVEQMPDKSYKVWVHVADPTRWVPPGSPLDQEAARRGKTVYLPTGQPLILADLLHPLILLSNQVTLNSKLCNNK